MSAAVLVLYTGGTIGMTATDRGLTPTPGLRARIEQQFGASLAELPSFELLELEPLIDSANITPAHWQRLAALLAEHWDHYQGFVILHGTDTMAYSAGALAFMLGACKKNVLFTGAQVPLGLPGSDAADNLRQALTLAVGPRIPDVSLVFNDRLLRGSRIRKVSSKRFAAFDSPNEAPLGNLTNTATLHHQRMLSADAASRAPQLAAQLNFQPGAVALLTLHPCMPSALYDALLADPKCRAVVLQSYGAGNIPSRDQAFNAFLCRARARNKVLVNISQCLDGGVSPGTYAASASLQEQGVLNGGDMTPEAAFCKLHWLIAGGRDQATVREDWAQLYCAERSPD